jgi:hypothetical protein
MYCEVLVTMKTFAQIFGSFVVNTIVAEQSFIDSLPNSDQFVEYDETNPAGIGHTYNSGTKTFSPPYTPVVEP